MTRHKTKRAYVSPFAGDPPTRMKLDDKGIMTFTVMPREMTARRMKWYDALKGLAWLALYGAAFTLWLRKPPPGDLSGLIPVLVVPWVLMALIKPPVYRMLTVRSKVVFTPTEFRVRTWKGWRVYDRTLTHKFVMLVHDRAREENEKRELRTRRAAQDGQVINPPRYYADSFHIVFEHLGQRRDVLEVYDKTRALAVVARFNACDDVADNDARMGNGEVLSPDGQWGDQPGGLPS